MTVETKLPYDKDYINQFSQDNNEANWMRDLRRQDLEQTESLEMPQPDKTNITKWNFSNFKHDAAKGEKIASLDKLPEDIQDFLDQKNTQENLLIQRNHTVAYASLSKKLEEK